MSAIDDPTCEEFRGFTVAPGDLVPTQYLARWAPEIALWLHSLGYTGSAVDSILGDAGVGALARREPAGVAAAVARAQAEGRATPALAALVSVLIARRPISRKLLGTVIGSRAVDMLVRSGVLCRMVPSVDSLAWEIHAAELGLTPLAEQEGSDEGKNNPDCPGHGEQIGDHRPAHLSEHAGKAQSADASVHQSNDDPAHQSNDDPAHDRLIVAMDLRFRTIDGREYLFFSDCDASMDTHIPGRNHVLGIGAASMSLLTSTARTPVKRVLDLGTGCGIQAVGQWACAEHIVATDIHPRATDFARANFAAAAVTHSDAPQTTVLTTSWFDGLEGEEFDRIISNPPFVVGPARTNHVYRDSGLAMDGATELMVTRTPEHLAPGGRAFLMGSWLHTSATPWQQRVARWVPSTGVRAWFLERDHVDPIMYVGTWVRDEGLDPRSPEGIARSQEWLGHFDPRFIGTDGTSGSAVPCDDDASPDRVEAIGFGFIVMERLPEDAPSEVVCEDFSHPIDHDLGAEFEDYLDRAEWLAQRSTDELLNHQYLVHPCLALEDVSVARSDGEPGFEQVVARVSRTDGPRWVHEVDAFTLTMLKGFHPQGLSARDLIDFALMANGVEDGDAEAVAQAWVTTLVDAIRHGIVLPAEWATES